MKILITGMNKSQCTRNHHLKQQLKIVPSHYSLYNCLVDMGHTVEQRMVEIGEDLSDYDEVFCYIAGPRQLVTTCLFNGLWAIHSRPDCIVLSDDWQLPDLFKGLHKHSTPDALLAEFILNTNKTTEEDVRPLLDQYLGAIDTLTQMKNRTLVSCFSTDHLSDEYGAHLLYQGIEYPKELIFTYNPNPYHRNRKLNAFGHIGPEAPDYVQPLIDDEDDVPARERRFNFASLVQSKTKSWLKKQGFVQNSADDESGMIGTWPVDLYGSKAESQKRLTEDEMCRVFYRDLACLMPGYSHAGSGWWRARPLQCADARCILIGDQKEMDVYYGQDFKYRGLKATDLLELSDQELTDIARAQTEAIYTLHPLDKEVQQQQIRRVLEAV